MNKAFRTVLLSMYFFGFLSFQTYAQQDHFVYIQSDEKVSFDVNVNGKTYNSSSIGYVIIPKLAKGNYQLSISFGNKKYPDQQFNCAIDKADAGFLLKNYIDKGWGLFNLQSSDIIMAVSASTVVPDPPKVQPTNDAFGDMLSQVSGDSTLNVKTEVEKPAVQKPVLVVGSAAIAKNENIIPQKDSIENDLVKDTPVVESKMGLPLYNNNALVKIKEVTTNDGTDMVFLDSSSGLNDTIRIFLPAQPVLTDAKEVQTKTPEKDSAIESAKIDSNTNVKKVNSGISGVVKQPDTSTSENGGVNNPFFAKEDQKKIDTNVTIDSGSVSKNNDDNAATASMPSSPECKNMLTESDMSKLRKKMVVAESDDKMINIVKKNIGDKCISTDQVKNLSALFLSDDGRLNFFSSVYTLVYDKSAFSSLEGQLIDPNYKKRFKDLIK